MIDFELRFKRWLLHIKKINEIIVSEYIHVLKGVMLELYKEINWDNLKKDKDDLLFFYMLANRERYRQYLCTDTIVKNKKDIKCFNKCLYYFNSIYVDKKTNSKQRNAFLAFYMFCFKNDKQYTNNFLRKRQEAIDFIERIIIDNFGKYEVTDEDAALYLSCSILDVKNLLLNKFIKLDKESVITYLNKIFCPSKYNRKVNFRSEVCCTVKEAAELLNCSTSTIHAYMNKRLIGYIRYSEKNTKIIKKDVLKLKNRGINYEI